MVTRVSGVRIVQCVSFQKEFQKRIKNGFDNAYSAKEIKMLKKRGAVSGCWKVGKSYPYGYDIFHK